jgi:hypothetical protein
MADSKIDGQVYSGSQQQWFTRNSELGSWGGGVWNMVFVGTVNAPGGAWPGAPYTVVPSTPLVQEKPFLFLDPTGSFSVMVPPLKSASQATSWSQPDAGGSPGSPVSLAQFYLAHAGTDTAASMNAALAGGANLLLTPGIYHLGSSLQVTRAGTIVLGLGLATLVPDSGTAALTIADVDGVKVGGVIVDAGSSNSTTLVLVGPPGASQDHSRAPTFLYDTFCRVGGATLGTASSCMTVNSSNVVGDNLWLWRADHGTGAAWDQNKSATGLIVNGSGVTMYGLAVEHFQSFQTMWNGNGGHVFFYQSEFPYDPPDQASWQHGGVNGYASYKVADSVTSHSGIGMGVYCTFQAGVVVADDAFEVPVAAGVNLNHLVTIWLSGVTGSAINHIVGRTGAGPVGAAATMTSPKATTPN